MSTVDVEKKQHVVKKKYMKPNYKQEIITKTLSDNSLRFNQSFIVLLRLFGVLVIVYKSMLIKNIISTY